MRRLAMKAVDIYRKHISQTKVSPCCRFTPSCSNYAYRALSEWGILVGTLLFLLRILRCSPLFKGGADGVPRRRRKLVPKTELIARVQGRSAVQKHRNCLCAVPQEHPYLTYYENYI